MQKTAGESRERSQRSTVLFLQGAKGSEVQAPKWTDGKLNLKKAVMAAMGWQGACWEGARASPHSTSYCWPRPNTGHTPHYTADKCKPHSSPWHRTRPPHVTPQKSSLEGGGGFFPMFPEELQRLAPLQLGTCVIHCLISGGNKVPICLSSWETGLQRRRIFVENHKLCFTKKKKSLHPCGGFSSACTSQISHAWIHALQKLLFFY